MKLKGSRAPKAVLQNFNLLRDGRPTNAAMLLFGKDPKRFFNNVQVHCFHFHGTVKQKPIASQQPYEGRLIEVIDEAMKGDKMGTLGTLPIIQTNAPLRNPLETRKTRHEMVIAKPDINMTNPISASQQMVHKWPHRAQGRKG